MQDVFTNIADWAKARNLIEGSTPQAQFLKLAEELGEVAECIAKGLSQDELKKELGDMLVVITIIAEQHGLSTNECATAAYEKIKHRKGRMQNGVFIREVD